MFGFDFRQGQGMFTGHKLGWWLSRTALYNLSLPLMIVLCIGWGALIGFALHSLIQEFSPGTIAKIFAYGAGAYASVPNYGLIAEASIPPEDTAFKPDIFSSSYCRG
jgi:hypothetical protein